jgi:hypothetical protein
MLLKNDGFDNRLGISIPNNPAKLATNPLLGDKKIKIIPHITIVEMKCGK